MAETRKILFLTGTRADFGKLRPLIEQVEGDSAFEAHIFATGMHMLRIFGYTFREIEKCGFKNVFPHYNQNAGSNEDMDFALANTVSGLGHYLRELEPDLLIVHGDRVEALAGAIAGMLNNILVGHIEGGEVSGTVDESLRHAISKLSHVHFVANSDAQRRLVQLGEDPASIFVTGSPDIDVMLSDSLPSLDKVRQRYEIPFEDYAILVYHSVTTELDALQERAREVASAARESGDNFVVLYPNNDTGSGVILEELQKLAATSTRFRLLPSLRFEYFLTLLREAKYILGNSSAGIREAPVYGVPTINVGTRQNGRFSGPSILNTSEDRTAILKATHNRPRDLGPSYHFGRGDSARRFIKLLRDPATWKVSRQKVFCDLDSDKAVNG